MGRQVNHIDDMPAEIDFSNGRRGRFFRDGARLGSPVYLESEVQHCPTARATALDIDVGPLANELLGMDIEPIEVAR